MPSFKIKREWPITTMAMAAATAKHFKVTQATMDGLDESIQKWVGVAETGAYGGGRRGCGLCALFNPPLGDPTFCDGCPITLDSGKYFCRGTPFADYSEAYIMGGDSTKHAQRELEYLHDLRSRCIVDPDATQNEVIHA